MEKKMEKLVHYLKTRKILLSPLSKRMGYTASYLSRVFNGHSPCSIPFLKLLIFALQEEANEKIGNAQTNLQELKKIIKE